MGEKRIRIWDGTVMGMLSINAANRYVADGEKVPCLGSPAAELGGRILTKGTGANH